MLIKLPLPKWDWRIINIPNSLFPTTFVRRWIERKKDLRLTRTASTVWWRRLRDEIVIQRKTRQWAREEPRTETDKQLMRYGAGDSERTWERRMPVQGQFQQQSAAETTLVQLQDVTEINESHVLLVVCRWLQIKKKPKEPHRLKEGEV